MSGLMMTEVVEAVLEERRREAARHRRAAAARRRRRSSGATAAWRQGLGRVLIAAGTAVGGPTALHRTAVRSTGGAR